MPRGIFFLARADKSDSTRLDDKHATRVKLGDRAQEIVIFMMMVLSSVRPKKGPTQYRGRAASEVLATVPDYGGTDVPVAITGAVSDFSQSPAHKQTRNRGLFVRLLAVAFGCCASVLSVGPDRF